MWRGLRGTWWSSTRPTDSATSMPANVIANTLKGALAERNKLLLTATPLRNSLLELFDLVSFIDERSFGDLKSFREQFAGVAQERAFDLLRERLKPICHRTLRRQVTAYVPYTKRHAILQEFSPDEAEDKLYNPSPPICSETTRRPSRPAGPLAAARG
jgi:SNF2 family DNA or RNA helicase